MVHDVCFVPAPLIYLKELIEHRFTHSYSKIEFVVQQLAVERNAASRYLQALKEAGILKSETKGKETIYIKTKLYELLKK